MLADRGEAPTLGRPAASHLHRQDRQPRGGAIRQRRRAKPAARGQVRVVEQLLGLADRRERQAGLLELRHQLGLGEALEEFPHLRQQALACQHALRVGLVLRVGAKLGESEGRAELLPEPVGDHADEDLLAVTGLEHVVDGPGRDAHGHGLRGLAGDGHLRHVLADQVHHGLKQRAGDLLALAGPVTLLQRGEDGDHAEHSAGDVDHRSAGAQRPPRRARHVGQAAHHLHHLVERGAILVGTTEEALLRAVDQPRVQRREVVVAEAELLHRPLAEVLDHHVGARRQAPRQLEPARVLEVQAEALLVAVVHGEVAGARAEQRARGIATDRLDLDDLGAELDQDGAHGGPHHHVRELDDLDARQRQPVARFAHATDTSRVAGTKPSGSPASGVNP